MDRTALSVALGLTIAALAVACAEEDELAAEDRWWSDATETACAATFQCECPRGVPWSSAQVCEQEMGPANRRAQNDAIAAGLTFDPDCAQEHRDAIAALGCKHFEELVPGEDTATCQIYYGDKRLGDACTPSSTWLSDCGQGLVCPSAGKRCATPEHPFVELAEGATCVDEAGFPVGTCPPPQTCDYGSKLCVTPAALGEPCSGDLYPCMDGWCDAGSCAPHRAAGEACESSRECTSILCDENVCAPDVPTPQACYAIAL